MRNGCLVCTHQPVAAEAEKHFTEALTSCRRIDLIELEPEVLRTWASSHRAAGRSEEDLLYGFRPGRNPHHGLDGLTLEIQTKRVNGVFDAARTPSAASFPHVIPDRTFPSAAE